MANRYPTRHSCFLLLQSHLMKLKKPLNKVSFVVSFLETSNNSFCFNFDKLGDVLARNSLCLQKV